MLSDDSDANSDDYLSSETILFGSLSDAFGCISIPTKA